MKRTIIFLPKFLYAAIFISVVLGLVVLGAGERLFEESEIQKQQSNHRQTESNGGLQVEIDDGIAKISDDWFHDSNFLNMNATNKQIVANKKLIVNNANLNFGFRLGNGVITMPAMNQPAERLTNQSDAKANQISTGRNIIKSVATIQSVVNQRVLAAGGGSASGVAPSNGVAGRAGAEGKNEPLSNKSDIHQQANNQYQGVSDRGLDVNIFQINSRYSGIHLNYSRSQVASINDIIPKVEFIVNKRNLRVFDPFSELGIIKNTPNQPAAKLISNSEMTERKVGMFSNAITRNYTSSTLRSEVYPTEKISAAGRGLTPQAYAAEAEKSPVIPLSLYQPLAGQIMFREALEKLPVDQRTPEKIAELITGISQLLSSLPAKGEIFLAGGKFSGLTGTSGILSGKVVKGTYRIKIDPVEGIDLIVPAAVEAGSRGSETVMIGLTPGKGKVKTAGETGVWQKVWQMIRKTDRKENQVLGTQVQSEIGDALPTAPLTIQLFRDENKNGVYDSGESLVEWAGVKMDLEPTTQSSSYNLTEGWNLIAFPVAPTSVTTAAEAVQDIAKEGGYVTTISTWEGDKWIEYSQRGIEKFGHDFGLAPGRAYFLESQLNSVWTVAGTPLPAENQVIQLRKGWNGVGIPKEGATAVQILDDLQAIGEVSQTSPCEVCETAEQAAKWNFGLWDVVVKRRYSPEHHEVYGRDFPVKSTEGYFLHLNQDTKLKFQ